MNIRSVILSMAASCALFPFLFAFVIHKPLTIGLMHQMFEQKLRHASQIQKPKLVIVAGSNGRFSHSCSEFERLTNVPCANLSVTAQVSLNFSVRLAQKVLRAGDVLFMPVEYGFLSGSVDGIGAGDEYALVVAYQRKEFSNFTLADTAEAWFHFDLPYLASAIGETTLDALGVKRRYSLDTLTSQGDEFGHSKQKGLNYQNYLHSLDWSAPALEILTAKSRSASELQILLREISDLGVTVIGGLPTTFDDEPIPKDVIESRREFFESFGGEFLVPANDSQYPRDRFYDTPYHLNEETQIQHTEDLTTRLIGYF